MRKPVGVLAIGSATLLVWSTLAFAFKPNEAGHLGITTEALTPITRSAGGETFRFSERALQQIRDANRNVDILEFFGVEQHFDDEAFQASTTRLTSLKESVIAKLVASPPDGFGARQDFGGALHTIQDFYSHSNWVEQSMTAIDARLGRQTFADPPPAPTFSPCPSDAGTLGADGFLQTTTGYFPFPDPCAGPPDGTPAGKCRHGLEVVCPDGLNKDAPGRPFYPEARGLAVQATVDYASQILDDSRIAGNAAALRAFTDAAGLPSGFVLVITDQVPEGSRSEKDVLIDSTVSRATFAITMEGFQRFRIFRPSGVAVAAGEPGVTIAADRRTVTIDAPEPGTWRARIKGTGLYQLRVSVDSPIQVYEFHFATIGGRAGHEGLASLGGSPVGGTETLAYAAVIGPARDLTFRLITRKGRPITDATLQPGSADAAASELVGTIFVPHRRFRFSVAGLDPNGFPFVRTSEPLFDSR